MGNHNVFSNASFCSDDCQWLHIWTSSIHDIQTHDCYTDTATQDVKGTNTPVSNITVVKRGEPWPEAALQIMQEAGLTGSLLGGSALAAGMGRAAVVQNLPLYV